jgi:hypothetical protein
MGRRVLLVLLSAADLVGLIAQPGAAANVPQPVVVSSNPADWTPHVLDGRVAAIVQIGNRIVAGASSPRSPARTRRPRPFPAATSSPSTQPPGRSTRRSRPWSTPKSSRWPPPDGLHAFAGGSFTRINGVAQKSLAKLRLSDGARITAFKGRTNARVKDMAVSGGRLYIGGTFNTANGVARSAPAGPTTVVTTGLGTSRGLLVLNLPT